MTIGEKIRQIRLSKRMSQTMVTYKCGISVRGLSRIELDGSKPDLRTIEKLAKAFKMTPGQILDWGEKNIQENKVNQSQIEYITEEQQIYLEKLESIPPKNRKQILIIIDTFIKQKVKRKQIRRGLRKKVIAAQGKSGRGAKD